MCKVKGVANIDATIENDYPALQFLSILLASFSSLFWFMIQIAAKATAEQRSIYSSETVMETKLELKGETMLNG